MAKLSRICQSRENTQGDSLCQKGEARVAIPLLSTPYVPGVKIGIKLLSRSLEGEKQVQV